MDYKKVSEAVKLCGGRYGIVQCKLGCCYYSGNDLNKCIPRMTADASTAITELLVENQALRNAANGFKAKAEAAEAENAALRKMQPVRLDDTSAQALALAAEVSELKQKLETAEADLKGGRDV